MRLLCLLTILALWPLQLAVAQVPNGNLVKNGGFEEALPAGGWVLDVAAAGQGIGGNSVYGVHAGRRSLRLVPNSQNRTYFEGPSLGFAQTLPAKDLRGKSIYFGGWVRVVGKATAIIRMLVRLDNGRLLNREVRLNIEQPNPVRVRDIVPIPADGEISVLAIATVVEGTSGNAFFDDVFATPEMPGDWPAGTGDPEPDLPLTATISVQAGSVVRTIPPTLFGHNMEFQYGGNAILDESTGRLNPDLVRLGSELGTTMLRFPAGFFSDYYHWTDGIGPPGTRPITRSMPGGSFTSHLFGTDEALAYADAIGAQLLITVNAGTGTPREAADWVRYVNQNGQRVKYWEVGNELYVDLSALDPGSPALTPEQYGERFVAFADAMREADPSIKIGAILDHKFSRSTFRPFPDWAKKVMLAGKGKIDFVAVHNGFAPSLGTEFTYNVRQVYSTMLATSVLVKESLAELGREIDTVLGPEGAKIEIAVTEWAPLFDTDPKSAFLDHPKTLASALYCASLLKTFVEDPRTTSAQAYKLVDALELGWIGLRNGAFAPKASYYAMQMFTKHFGTVLIDSKTTSPGYEARSLGWVDAVPFVPYLESLSSLNEDGSKMYILAINKSTSRNVASKLSWTGFCAEPQARTWNLAGTSPDANTGTQLWARDGLQWAPQAEFQPNGRFNLGGPNEIWVDPETTQVNPSGTDYLFPAFSVTAIELTRSKGGCS
ncbi:MAG TPA: hypothetical protein VGK29_18315 [Paludibaculum sp.]|jgi:alpha-N-arabinofuranosidase